MKKYAPFFIIFLLLSAIPAVSIILFPNAASSINSGVIPTFGLLGNDKANAGIEKQTSHYLIRLNPASPPLRSGPQTLKLEILNRDTGSHWDGVPALTITTPTEPTPETAPVQVKPLSETGFYEIKTDFKTAGQWEISLELQMPEEQIQLSLYVPAG